MPTKKLQVNDYVHLHNHTQYSLLDGLTRLAPLMELVKDEGMHAVAMTDHGTLSGAVDFYKEAKAQDVKPIIGIETYIANRKHTDKDPAKDKNRYHLVLLAMNNKGYENLMRLSTIANLDGYYYFPRVDRELLEKYNEGIIALSACMGSEIGDALKRDQYDQAKDIAKWYRKTFDGRYYLEVQDHGHPKNPLTNKLQQSVNEQVLRLSKELDIPAVVTCDAHYLKHEDQEAHEILLCVGTGAYLSEEKRMSLKEFPLHVESPKDLIKRWGSEYPELITNTKKIAERCNVELDLGKILIPEFPVPKGETEKSYLDKLVYQGLAWRYSDIDEEKASKLSIEQAKKKLDKELLERAEYELGVIDKMGFNGYFLIISDFINWGKDKGIVFGPGRGSAAGSIISYGLKITELDPIKYDLLFERFLNPDRISMPDIDIDIQDTRRNEVIKYCVEKYGEDKVANIVTFGRMFARNAVRDVARVLQVPYGDADRLAKMIPPPVQGRHIPLEKSLKDDADLKREYKTNEVSKRVLDLAVKLEGTVRSHGVHAAGVVIAPDDIVKFVPLEMAQKGVISTQYPMGPVEELGLLKMDFLGLSNLTIIKNTLRIIKKVHQKELGIEEIPLDDEETFKLFQRGDTTGVFQLESAGMKRYLKELKPTVFDDIIAMVALYRPGPMQFIDDFIARKHGKKKIEYLHPKMENALKNTYGILVYQEQFMQISKDLAGFSGGQADTLRKAVGKKIMKLMQKVKPEFIDGAVEHSGADRPTMEKFWGQLEEFANYCFNKSHAACYALIAYWTAYLKAHFPAAFMAALMTSDYDDTDRLAIEINECLHMGMEVLPPDINESFVEFAVVPDTGQIRFGMAAIKNVGSGAVEEIIRVRKEHGHFESLEDFFGKVNTRIVNRKVLESLIKSGAFDRYGERSVLLHNLDGLLAYASRIQKERQSGQTDLFGGGSGETAILKDELKLVAPPQALNKREQLIWERELLGLYISENPLKTFEAFLEEKTIPLDKITESYERKTVSVGGAIQEFREITTKNGKKMAFAKIADNYSEIELILFPSTYQQTLGIWQQDSVILAKGKVSSRDKDGNLNGEPKIMVDEAREVTFEQAEAYQPTGKKTKLPKPSISVTNKPKSTTVSNTGPKVYIRVESSKNYQLLQNIKQTIDSHHGSTEVVLVLGNGNGRQAIKLPMKISSDNGAIEELGELAGRENVKIH